ncbi:MAG TPA: hypothetical protein VEB20_23990 [Azospirillaceae bacterium]|nr:hypothetical protein [Azospirillaceae bacterium]
MFSRDDLARLLNETTNPAISIFLPTHVRGREIRQDPVRLKNLLDETRDRLLERGMRRPEVEALLQPAYRLTEDIGFWRHQGQGLALYLSPGNFHMHRLPIEVEEGAHINDRFVIRPLLPILAADGRFAVLAITQTRAHLFEASRFSLREVEADELPHGTAALFGGDVPQEDGTVPQQTVANATAAPNNAAATSQRQVRNDELMQYLRQLAAAVDSYLGGTGTPLVLAADERVAGHFRQANKYQGLLEQAITDQPDSVGRDELHRRAYELVRPLFEKRVRESLDRFRMLSGDGSGRGVDEVAKIVTAAVQGRVERLFLREGATCWGRYLAESGLTVLHTAPKEGDRELLDFAAVNVVDKDGAVFTLPADAMPTDAPVAATLRF